jgi:hypothetical protein
MELVEELELELKNHRNRCRCCFRNLDKEKQTFDITKQIQQRFYDLTQIEVGFCGIQWTFVATRALSFS